MKYADAYEYYEELKKINTIFNKYENELDQLSLKLDEFINEKKI